MPIRVIPDEDQPSAAIEISLATPLPDYDLVQLDQPTPRNVDVILVSQGFRDLVDDARGVLMDLLAHPPFQAMQISISPIPPRWHWNSRSSLAPSVPETTRYTVPACGSSCAIRTPSQRQRCPWLRRNASPPSLPN
jgi:hypothetical protein